jgi:hypothetical protein
MVRAINLLRSLLIASVVLLSLSAQGHQAFFGPGGGGDHPWPWGLEAPFPWDDIQGIWKLDLPRGTFYFGFRRLEAKRLIVSQFDIDACLVKGTGPGLEHARTVVAQMSGPSYGVYRVTLYAFRPEDSPEPPKMKGTFEPGRVMVARIYSLTTPGAEIASQMVKMTSRLEIRCPRQNKFLKF